MVDKVAVIANDSGETTFVQQFGKIIIYEKHEEQWISKREIEYTVDIFKGTKGIRESLQEIVKYLGDCRVIVGSEVSGVFYNILDMENFKIWEFNGNIEDFFDYIIANSNEQIDICNTENNEVSEPIGTGEEGCYYLDLIKLQVNKASVSSKQALLPFLKVGNFKKLSVVCKHVPPWLEGTIRSMKMKMDIEKKQKEYEVTISTQ